MTRFVYRKTAFFFCAVFLFASSCRKDLNLSPIDQNISGPSSVATNPAGDHFYVLNADFMHNYESGSLLILNDQAHKVGAIATPRLGRTLLVSGNNLFLTFDHESEDTEGIVQFYDISTSSKPKLVKEWKLEECTPANLVSREAYQYFAVSCQEGDLYVGQLKGTASTLKKVRAYPGIRDSVRKAMHIDPKRQLLFLFLTDINGGVNNTDLVEFDQETWVSGKLINRTPDEIPDAWQKTDPRSRDLLNNSSRYQFMLYDIAAEAAAGFPFRDFKTVRSTEPRWLYFNLNNFDQTPDDATNQGDSGRKYYRTNFGDAQPDPEDPDSFYLSHRGLGKVNASEYANDIVKVTLFNEARANSSGKVPKLTDYARFSRVYGFKGDETGPDKYFDSFIITKLAGQKVVLLNSFRDLSTFSNPRYQIGAANLVERDLASRWITEVSSADIGDSYYRVSLAKNGNMLTISFFDESLRLFNVKFGETISYVDTIQ